VASLACVVTGRVDPGITRGVAGGFKVSAHDGEDDGAMIFLPISGMGGMAAAALSRVGKRVLLLEQHHTLLLDGEPLRILHLPDDRLVGVTTLEGVPQFAVVDRRRDLPRIFWSNFELGFPPPRLSEEF
jgi:hypothetical protein